MTCDEVVNYVNLCFVEEMGDKSQSTHLPQISTTQLASEGN
jgi:putative Ca2+/H+ antiporter (TMEM165/GDT1 family)